MASTLVPEGSEAIVPNTRATRSDPETPGHTLFPQAVTNWMTVRNELRHRGVAEALIVLGRIRQEQGGVQTGMLKKFTPRIAVLAVALAAASLSAACSDDDATTDDITDVTTDLDPGAGSGLPGDSRDETTTTTVG